MRMHAHDADLVNAEPKDCSSNDFEDAKDLPTPVGDYGSTLAAMLYCSHLWRSSPAHTQQNLRAILGAPHIFPLYEEASLLNDNEVIDEY